MFASVIAIFSTGKYFRGATHLAAIAACLVAIATGFHNWRETILLTGFLFALKNAGITLGFHRLGYHKQAVVGAKMLGLLNFFGTTAGIGGPKQFNVSHRNHHRYTDQHSDPHAPLHGFAMAHGGFLSHELPLRPTMKWLDRYSFVLPWAWAGITAGVIWSLCGGFTSLEAVAWSSELALQATYSLASFGHLPRAAYRNFATNDDSQNVWWLFPILWGENWHNNHHEDPKKANHRSRWWEFDVWYLMITLIRV